jgi:Tol biopolymer transport system component
MYLRKRRTLTPYFAIIFLLVLFALIAIFLTPQVVNVQPKPDAQRLFSANPIQIQFNQSMDRVSVEARLRIEPSVGADLHWEGKTLVLTPHQAWPEGEKIEIELDFGARSIYFLPLVKTYNWSLEVGAPRLIYLWPSGGQADLYALQPREETTVALTQTPNGILDFKVSPQGTTLVFAQLGDNGGSEIHQLDLISLEDQILHDCAMGWLCYAPTLAPDLDYLAFERRSIQPSRASETQVWILPLEDDLDAFMMGLSNHSTSAPSWSSEGFLEYYDNTDGEIKIVRISDDGRANIVHAIPSQLGKIGSWSPDGSSIVFPELIFVDELENFDAGESAIPLFYSHIYQYILSTGSKLDLTGNEAGLVEDASPFYSPDGKILAFTRKFLDQEKWTLGRQIWIASADGSGAMQITNDPASLHLGLAWSFDSQALAYQRVSQADLDSPPEIWLFDRNDETIQLLIVGGYAIQWIP